jgi:hypothetical protein
MGRAPTPISAVRGVALLLAALALAVPVTALGDADPASDVLLLQHTFLPGSPLPSGELSEQLRGVTARARRAGFALKVAVIGSPSDLGAIPAMFGHPQRYAGFLGTELTAGKLTVPLLVVMPAGFGTFELSNRAAATARMLSAPPANSDGLVRAAIDAIVKLSAAEGHPVKPPAAKGGGGSGPTALIFIVPVVLLVLAGLAVSRRTRRANAGHDLESGA